MATRDSRPRDHGDPGDAPTIPPPLAPVVNSVRPSAAEEARTIAASTNTGTLAPYVLMMVVLLVRPHGLFGTKEVERV